MFQAKPADIPHVALRSRCSLPGGTDMSAAASSEPMRFCRAPATCKPARFHRGLTRGLLAALLLATIERGAAQTLGLEDHARSARYLHGRTVHGNGDAAALAAARVSHLQLAAQPRAANLTATWSPVGPNAVANPIFGNVTGRVTAVLIDSSDTTGNTVYVGTTGGGVWKSANAAGPASAVTFAPLTDTLPVFTSQYGSSAIAALSIGSLAKVQGTLLAGTGDPNDATDSYYGSGILRSIDGGLTWTLAGYSNDGVYGVHSLAGLSVAGLAISTPSPFTAAAALMQSPQSVAVGAETSPNTFPGLYGSSDGGVTWQYATVWDTTQVGGPTDPTVVQSPALGVTDTQATSVVWNPTRQAFYAAIRNHGYYQSQDGLNWTRLAHQPGPGLTLAACPTIASSSSHCPLGRGVLAVQPVTGDIFALTVDAQNNDEGLYQDTCAQSHGACSNPAPTFSTTIDSSPLELAASTTILQADYNLALAAAASANDTILYAGTIDLYRCTLAGGCVLRDTTNAQDGCITPAGVAGAQHALAASGALLFTGNDGGLWRSTDGVAETGGVCSATDATHFDNLNGGLGSLAEIVSFAQDPVESGTLLAGLGALGSAGTGSALNANGSPSGAWTQLSTGEGGTVAIDPVNPSNWFLSMGAGVEISHCSKGPACALSDFASPTITSTQVAGDSAALHAPWLLDPGNSTQLLLGTCRAWRGIAAGGITASNLLSSPFAAPQTSSCPATLPVVRSLGAGGPTVSASPPAAGSTVLYAGLEGLRGSTTGLYGHLFATTTGSSDSSTTAWTDLALSPVTNAAGGNSTFNAESLDISSITVDPHDATGKTVYATLLGFSGTAASVNNVYRSVDGGAHWTTITSNLPAAPANSLLVDPNDANTVYVALDTGVYVTTSVTTCASTDCWSVYGTGLPNSPVTQLAAASAMSTGDGRTGELRAATYGRGIWQIPLITAMAPAAPVMTLGSSSISFPAQQSGTQSNPVTVKVTNTGNALLNVTSVVTTNGFTEQDNCVAAPVLVSGSCSVQVTFAPTYAGPNAGLLTIYANVAGGQAVLPLTGTGTAPAQIVLTPTSLTFPATSIGATSPAEDMTVANLGGTPATLGTVSITGPFAFSANSCSSTLAVQSSCTLVITFSPAASGAFTGTVTVVSPAGTLTGQLNGVGTAPATDTLSPLALSFSQQQIGTSSASQQVTLTNSGDDALTLISANATGDFTVVNGCGASLPGHSTCALNVAFVPSNIGAETGSVTVSDEFRTQTITLAGTGIAPPGVSVAPSTGLVFQAMAVGQQSAPQTVTVTNNGGEPLSFSIPSITGDFSIASNTCGAVITPGSACELSILFTASVGGPRTGNLTLNDNATSSPQVVPLSGTGVDYSLASSGASSATITSGQTASYLLLLQANAGVPGSATLTCSGAPTNATCTVSPASAPLYTPNGTVITVTLATGVSHAALEPLWSAAIVWLALLLPTGLVIRRRPRLQLFAITLCVCLTLGACGTGRTIPDSGGGGGGSSTSPVTPAGSYTLVVTATSAGLVKTVNLTLTVQ